VRMLADEHILRRPGRLESVTFVEILDGTPKNRVGGRQVCLDRGTDLHVHVLPNREDSARVGLTFSTRATERIDMKIQIDEMQLLPDLVAFLERLDVASHRLAPDMVEVRVVRPLSDQVDEAADRLTIVQTLRDWCSLHPGVRADIVH
jgi:hypothetical protein